MWIRKLEEILMYQDIAEHLELIKPCLFWPVPFLNDVHYAYNDDKTKWKQLQWLLKI